jgi:biopolymer transport protein ExbB
LQSISFEVIITENIRKDRYMESQPGLNLIQIIHQGAIATYPLIVMSVISLTVIFERLWSLRNIGSATVRVTDSILEPTKKGQRDLAIAICKQNSNCPAGRIFLNVLEREGSARPDLAGTAAGEAMFEETQKLKKHLWILGTVASSAPFIGLLGTVVGIIKSFESMAVAGTGGFAVVAAGISEALVATALGLGVAIIALIFYNYFQTRIATLNGLFRVQVGKILQTLSV